MANVAFPARIASTVSNLRASKVHADPSQNQNQNHRICVCQTQQNNIMAANTSTASYSFGRREFLKGSTRSSVALLPLLQLLSTTPSAAAREVEVGSYLPPSPSDPSFVLFKASPADTPALRAGSYFAFFPFYT